MNTSPISQRLLAVITKRVNDAGFEGSGFVSRTRNGHVMLGFNLPDGSVAGVTVTHRGWRKLPDEAASSLAQMFINWLEFNKKRREKEAGQCSA